MFYKETDFKEEPFIGEIPKDWDVAKLGDKSISEIIMGQSPPSSTYNKDGVGLPFLQGKMEFGDICPKVLVYCSKPIKIAEPNDVLFSVRAPVGDVNLAPYKLCIGRGLAAIRFNNERVSHSFYFYWFQKIKKHLEALGKGSTFKAVNKDDLENLRVPLPPLNEQRGIVGVLGVVDSVIAKTGEVIAKTERLKKGLMQTLLTRGIGHKEYKQTPIGTIPKTWQVTTTSDVTLFIKDGTHTPPRRVENGIPLFSAQNIVDGKIVRTNEDTYITEEEYWKIHTKYEIQKNDVLLTIVGTIGNTAIVDVDYRFTLQRSVAIFRPDTEKIEPRFLHYAFQSDSFKRQLLGHSKLTTQGGVYLKELSSLMIPVPPFEEQHKITNILSSIDAKLELEKKEKVRLERIKHGLMDLLLTGKIRVKVD